MSPDAWPLALGTLLALGAMSFVLYPLLGGADQSGSRAERMARWAEQDAAVFTEVANHAIQSPTRMEHMSSTNAGENAGPTPGSSSGASAAELDPVEAAVRAAQARRPKCVHCGPRPESDAIYCSSCGGYLPGACGQCGTAVERPSSRYCTNCGGSLLG
jgi:hypothetical protein